MNSSELHHTTVECDNYPLSDIPQNTREPLERLYGVQMHKLCDTSSSEEARLNQLRTINNMLGAVRAYGRDDLNNRAYEAAALAAATDQAIGGNGRIETRALEALSQYFADDECHNADGTYTQDALYVAGILRDQVDMKQLRNEIAEKCGASSYDKGVPPETSDWLEQPGAASLNTLKDAVSNNNVESILMLSSEMAQRLDSPNLVPDRDVLNDIRFTEQVLSQVSEVVGFDALAMSLNSSAKIIRLTNGHRRGFVDIADSVLHRIDHFDEDHGRATNTQHIVQNIIGGIYHKTPEDNNIKLSVKYNVYNNSICGSVMDDEYVINGEPIAFSWRYRLKTAGSLAWKLSRDYDKRQHQNLQDGDVAIPMDVVGLTAVVDNDEDQRKVFGQLIRGIYGGNDSVQPHNAPSRNSAIHITGVDGFVDGMLQDVPTELKDKIDIVRAGDENALHLGKVTGVYQGNIPFEIQVVTKKYRELMQVGSIAHVIYKAVGKGLLPPNEAEEWTSLLRSIRSRRKNIGQVGLVGSYESESGHVAGQNEQRAAEFLNSILTSRQTINKTMGKVALLPSQL